MHCTRWVIAALFLLLALGGCNVQMGTFVVPPQVWAGQVFEVVVTAFADGQSGSLGAILQLPQGFAVEGAVAVGRGSGGIVVPGGGQIAATPTLLAVEPGHFATEFAGSYVLGLGTPSSAALKVYVRAGPTGTFTLKVALWGSNGVLPAGATSFAAITTAPHAQPITVVGSPVTPFHGAPVPLGSTVPVDTSGIALVDVDGDGLDDVAASSVTAGVFVLRNRGAAPWSRLDPPAGAAGARYRRVVSGDFDGDGHVDLADSSGRVLFGDGGSSWTPGPVLPLLIPDWAGVAAGDVDGDGRDDVAFSAWTTDAVQVFRSQPNRTFADWSLGLPNGTNGPAGADRLVIADVSGDGQRDLVAGGSIGLRAWTGDGLGHWQAASTGLPPVGAFTLGDLDVDGQPEVVVSTPLLPVGVFEFAAGVWQQRAMPAMTTTSRSGAALAVLDHDRDGWPDVVVAAPGSGFFSGFTLELFASVGGQSFAAPVTLTTTLLLTDIQDVAAGDIDGDTWPDLAVAITGEPPIVWHNTGSGSSSFGAACGAAGWPTPRTAAIGQPFTGNASFAVGLQGASPQGLGLIWVGLSNRHALGAPILPYDLTPHGAPGCAVFASTEAPRLVLADAQGNASVPLPIPNDPALRRMTVFAQGAAAAPGANALGWLFANGLAVKIP